MKERMVLSFSDISRSDDTITGFWSICGVEDMSFWGSTRNIRLGDTDWNWNALVAFTLRNHVYCGFEDVDDILICPGTVRDISLVGVFAWHANSDQIGWIGHDSCT